MSVSISTKKCTLLTDNVHRLEEDITEDVKAKVTAALNTAKRVPVAGVPESKVRRVQLGGGVQK